MNLNNQKICLKEFVSNNIPKGNYHTDTRIKLNPDFKKAVFTKLLKKFGRRRLKKELKISGGMLYHYKNNRVNNIPLNQLTACVKLLGLDMAEIKDEIEDIFSRKEQINKDLTLGLSKRLNQLKNYKKEIPKISELIDNGVINFEKWFDKYINLINFGCRQIINIKKEKSKIIFKYTCYSLSRKKLFENSFPKKIKIDPKFEYFFGLWCGDRVGKGRFGVVNKEKAINLTTKDYLLSLYQNPVFVLHVNKDIKIPKLDYVDGIYINKYKTKIKGYAIWVYSKNAILFTFFNYIQKHLDEFIGSLPHKNIFFAGLFDAEGNIFLEDGCFRWSCKDKEKVKIYQKYLSQMNLYKRYDGANLVGCNLKNFAELIWPYIKHPTKINDFNLIYFNQGKLNKRFLQILDLIYRKPGRTNKELAKDLKRAKVFSQLRFLEKMGFIKRIDYPKRAFITNKGMASRLAMGARTQ